MKTAPSCIAVTRLAARSRMPVVMIVVVEYHIFNDVDSCGVSKGRAVEADVALVVSPNRSGKRTSCIHLKPLYYAQSQTFLAARGRV